MITFLLIGTLAAWLIWLLSRSRPAIAYTAAAVALVLQGYWIATVLVTAEGWHFDLKNTLLVASWLSAITAIVARIRSHWVHVPLTLFAMAAVVIAYLERNHVSPPRDFSWQLDLHITLSLVAFAILLVATLFAGALWHHIRTLKNNPSQISNHTISVLEEEQKLFTLILIGWLTLTTALVSGLIFVRHFLGENIGHKVLFSLLAWFVFGFLLAARALQGWRGEKAVRWAVAGMALLAIGFIGTKFVAEWLAGA
jgi:ABC-type uncharacterized transport system permease subunit